jgi:hypothetical protein
MEWLEGEKLMSFKAADAETRNALALNMFRAWYVPFYNFGVIHGDPHLGNYTVRPDLDINLLDFGCVRLFPPRFVKGVIDLFWALMRNDRDARGRGLRELGLHRPDQRGDRRLEPVGDLPLRPAHGGPGAADPGDQCRPRGPRGRRQGAPRLKEVGGVTPPREFVFMDRAAIGLGSVFLHLDAEINWHQMFLSLVGDFDLSPPSKSGRARRWPRTGSSCPLELTRASGPRGCASRGPKSRR